MIKLVDYILFVWMSQSSNDGNTNIMFYLNEYNFSYLFYFVSYYILHLVLEHEDLRVGIFKDIDEVRLIYDFFVVWKQQ